MGLLGRLADLIDAVITGRPPRVIERQFGWLRDMGYGVLESGCSRMTLYATYASERVLVRVTDDYHYEFVGVWLAQARGPDGVGPDIALGRLLEERAPTVQWDGDYGDGDPGAGEAKLAEAADLLRRHCTDLLRGKNVETLAPRPETASRQQTSSTARRDPGSSSRSVCICERVVDTEPDGSVFGCSTRRLEMLDQLD